MSEVISGQKELPIEVEKMVSNELDQWEISPGLNIDKMLALFQDSHKQLEERLDEIKTGNNCFENVVNGNFYTSRFAI